MNKDLKLEIIVALIYAAQYGGLLLSLVMIYIFTKNPIYVLVGMGIGLSVIMIGNLIYRKLTSNSKQQNSTEVSN